ncbi:MAG: CPBP family intramembrane metalloprotease [Odoribacteraceae bacterium]|jgi:membrane protease YdiL (CAAX protease family)|nr:CPBP family intramembrane metalloprotease [Odoribacteraceae bacterium]
MFLEKAYAGQNNRWSAYLFTVVVVFVAMQVGAIPDALYRLWMYPDTNVLPAVDVVRLALALFSFVVTLAALLACVKYLHGKPVGALFSGRRRFDFHRVIRGAVIWGVLLLLMTGVTFAITRPTLRFQLDWAPFLGTCLVLALLLPFQVACEECLCRGYLMQGFAALFKYRWIPLALTSLIFGLLHGLNPEVVKFGFWTMMPKYVLMGLLLGYVTIKDGGLELALGLHFINNLLSALLVTHESSALQTPALFVDVNPVASHWETLAMAVAALLFIWLCNKKYHFMHHNNLRGKVEDSRKFVPLASETENNKQ